MGMGHHIMEMDFCQHGIYIYIFLPECMASIKSQLHCNWVTTFSHEAIEET